MATELKPKTTTLGKSGIAVPVYGLGCAPVGGLPREAEEQALNTIRYALAQGANLFDTAPLYGQGRSEELVGKALAGVPREQYLISTKVGRVLEEDAGGKRSIRFDFSRDGVMRSLESSFKRLNIDYVDMLHIHDPDNHQEEAIAEAYPTLDELRRQGVTRAIGAGMNQWQALMRFAQEADFDLFLLAGRYTLLEQTALEFLELCRSKGIGIFLGGVFNSGILAQGAVPGATYQYRQAPPEIVEQTRQIEAVCARHGVTLSAAALQFAQAHPATSSLVIGAQKAAEIEANLTALIAPIPPAFWQELRSRNMVDANAPLPEAV